MEAAVYIDNDFRGDSRCVHAGYYHVNVDGDTTDEKAAAVFEILYDVLKPRLLRRLGKSRLKEFRARLLECPETPYARLHIPSGNTCEAPIPKGFPWFMRCGADDRQQVSEALFGFDARALILQVPCTPDDTTVMRVEVCLGWDRTPGHATLFTRTTVWSEVGDLDGAPDGLGTSPMHEVYRILKEKGALVPVDDAPEGSMRHRDELAGAAEATVHGRPRVASPWLVEANDALDTDDAGLQDRALHRLWADVQVHRSDLGASQVWQSCLASTAWQSGLRHGTGPQKAENGTETGADDGESGRIASLERSLAAMEKAADDAAARLREAEKAHRRELDRERTRRKEAESRLMGQLKEARADSGAARKEAEALWRRLGEAEAASKEGSEDASRELAEERGLTEALQGTVERLDAQVSERDNEIRRLQAQIEALKASAAAVVDPGWGETSMPVSEMVSVPRSLDEVLSLAEQAWPERLLVLESAHEAARAWSGRDMDRPWRALCAVAECLWSLHFAEGGADEVARFSALTGFRYSPTESKTVSSMPQLREARTFLWDGVRTFMPGHVAVTGGSGDSNIRLHLCFDEEGRRIVIGHLGRHLPNTLT